MIKGDIVLIPFPFTDLTGNKTRPALVLIDSEEDVTVCFITTQLTCQSAFDFLIQPSESNGFKRVSLVKQNKMATLDKDLIIGRLGSIEKQYMVSLNRNLIGVFKISDDKLLP